MKHFVKLYNAITHTDNKDENIKSLLQYFEVSEDADKLWAIALFSHKRPKRLLNSKVLKSWALDYANLSEWLFDETNNIVGDISETISLILPKKPQSVDDKSLSFWIDSILEINTNSTSVKKSLITNAWDHLGNEECYLFNKLVTGAFRKTMPSRLISIALSQYLSQDEKVITHRLVSDWSPQQSSFQSLFLEEISREDSYKPYPFYLANTLSVNLENLGNANDWIAEKKLIGIRVQLICRSNQIFLWTRKDELITNLFPEFKEIEKIGLKDFVIDGQLMIVKDGKYKNFQAIEQRLTKKKVSKKLLEESPAVLVAYDILEYNGIDVRKKKLVDRKENLLALSHHLEHTGTIQISYEVAFSDWNQLLDNWSHSRSHYTDGIVIKNKNSKYAETDSKSNWYKWKADPYKIHAVLIYAERSQHHRARYSTFTFALWEDDKLVPITKVENTLSEEDNTLISKFVKENKIDKFGPVISVEPKQVFEIAYDAVSESRRRKSGVVLKEARLYAWAKQLTIDKADDLSVLKVKVVV